MNAFGYLVVLLVIALPLAWIISGYQDRRWLRLAIGTLSILMSFGIAYIVGSLDRFNSNAWFGVASKTLIDTTVSELEAGNRDRVLRSLKELQRKYSPTYENRARYDEWVEEAVTRMRAGTPP